MADPSTSGDINVSDTSGSGIAAGHDAQATHQQGNVNQSITASGDAQDIRQVNVEEGGIYIENSHHLITRSLHQLRPPNPDFVGRATKIAQLIAHFTGSNNHTAVIRGMGGIGKTELSYVVAHELREHFPDAQLVLPMLGATDTPKRPETALQEVIRAFNPTARLPEDLSTLEPLYLATLHGKRVLILVDDARDAAQVRPLLPPLGCALLITTRHRFNLRGMQRFDLELLSSEEAEHLLCRICPRIGNHAPKLAELCGYLPLALEISAGMLTDDETLGLPRYIQRLQQQRLTALHAPDATTDDAQASVAASLQLSYASLPPDAQHTLHCLAVFVGSFNAAALTAVLVDIPDALEQASLLHRRSILGYHTETERYDMHELVRVFALEHLEANAAIAHATRLHHAYYYAAVAEQAQNDHYLQGDPLQGLTLFDHERPQIDAAWGWLMQWKVESDQQREVDELLLAFANATTLIGDLRYDLQWERIPQSEALVVAAQRLGRKDAEGMALGNLGNAYRHLGQVERAIDYYEQYLAIARELGDRRGERNSLGNLGGTYHLLGQIGRAIDYYEQTLAITRELGDRRGEGTSLCNLGLAYADLGQVARAIDHYEQDLAIARELGNRRGEGTALSGMGLAYTDLGQVERAIDCHEQHLAIARELGDRRGAGTALGNLGIVYRYLGQVEQAIDYYKQHLAIAQELGDRRGEGTTLGNLGLVYADMGQVKHAIACYEQAITIDREIGNYSGVARHSWNMGLLYVQQDNLARAAELMQIDVDYKREIGHTNAEQRSERVEQIRQKMRRKRSGSTTLF
jgi:tetratricopeptide (TPR) repeat protein